MHWNAIPANIFEPEQHFLPLNKAATKATLGLPVVRKDLLYIPCGRYAYRIKFIEIPATKCVF